MPTRQTQAARGGGLAERFTGENPPRSLWARYPNWENAIDEEGFADQVFNDDARQIGVTQQPRESWMDGDW